MPRMAKSMLKMKSKVEDLLSRLIKPQLRQCDNGTEPEKTQKDRSPLKKCEGLVITIFLGWNMAKCYDWGFEEI